MNSFRVLALAFFTLLSAPLAANADAYIAVSASYGKIGTGSGASIQAAIKMAYANCKKATGGRKCGYHYWTKSKNVLVLLYCEALIEGEIIQGALAAHHKSSLAKAEKRAFSSINLILANASTRLRKKNCALLATYSDGKFTVK